MNEDYGWSDLAKGGVTVTIVPGAHEKILEEPCVETVARHLAKFIELQMSTTPADRIVAGGLQHANGHGSRPDGNATKGTVGTAIPSRHRRHSRFQQPGTVREPRKTSGER